MQTAYMNLVRYAILNDMTVSVWDGEDWQVKRSKKSLEIFEAVESVEEATLRIIDADGNFVGSAFVSAYGLEPDETVIDWTDNAFMEGWYSQYEETL